MRQHPANEFLLFHGKFIKIIGKIYAPKKVMFYLRKILFNISLKIISVGM